jgi:hypothetical protein
MIVNFCIQSTLSLTLSRRERELFALFFPLSLRERAGERVLP